MKDKPKKFTNPKVVVLLGILGGMMRTDSIVPALMNIFSKPALSKSIGMPDTYISLSLDLLILTGKK